MREIKAGSTVVLIGGLCLVGGCRRDVRLAGRDVRSVTVQSVTHFGVTLDEEASPQDVAYVLLRAIREDFLASSSTDRKAALDKQFDICAANVIKARNRTGLSGDEFVYNVVYRWTPTVAHYVDDFETDRTKASERLVPNYVAGDKAADPNVEECEVLMELDDPSGDPKAQVVVIVRLARDGGFWRVLNLSFDTGRRSMGEEE